MLCGAMVSPWNIDVVPVLDVWGESMVLAGRCLEAEAGDGDRRSNDGVDD